MEPIILRRPMKEESDALNVFFRTVLEHTFESNDLGAFVDSMKQEIEDKRRCLSEDFETNGKSRFFLVAWHGARIVGTIAYGPSNATIVDCSRGSLKDVLEIGTVFVDPSYQRQGILTILLDGIAKAMVNRGEHACCFDSGYPIAQKIWTKKFGEPLYWLKDFWAVGADHMVWKVSLEHEGLRGQKT